MRGVANKAARRGACLLGPLIVGFGWRRRAYTCSGRGTTGLDELVVAVALGEHAECLDWEDELVVWVGDHATTHLANVHIPKPEPGATLARTCPRR